MGEVKKKMVWGALVIMLLTGGVAAKPDSPASEPFHAPEPARDSANVHIQWIGIPFSIVPGLFLHGSGHYLSGRKEEGVKLMKTQGLALGGFVLSMFGIIYTAGSGITSPVLYPMASFSGALFAMTWFSDVLGVSGVSGSLDPSRPMQKQSFLDFHFAHQEDHQSPYHRFLNFTAQYGRDDFFLSLMSDQEAYGGYQDYHLKGGYNLKSSENLELYVMGGMRRQQSEEGIALTHLEMPLHVDLDLGWFIRTLKHVYFQNWISYGYQWFHFNGKTDFINDMSIGQMSFGQRLRFYFTDYLQIGTGYHRENNQLLGGTDFLLMVFHHDLRFDYKGFLSHWKVSHGLGYRLSGSLGVQF
jgi:hypothetical protein